MLRYNFTEDKSAALFWKGTVGTWGQDDAVSKYWRWTTFLTSYGTFSNWWSSELRMGWCRQDLFQLLTNSEDWPCWRLDLALQRAVSFAYTSPYPEIKKGLYIMMIILIDDNFCIKSLWCTVKVNLNIWKSSAFFVVRHCLCFIFIKSEQAYAQQAAKWNSIYCSITSAVSGRLSLPACSQPAQLNVATRTAKQISSYSSLH